VPLFFSSYSQIQIFSPRFCCQASWYCAHITYPHKTTAEILFLTVNFGILERYYDMSVTSRWGHEHGSRGTHRRNLATRWSQWPHGLRHEPFSSVWTLGLCVGIPLEVWMSVCVYSVFVLSCVGSGLATGWSPLQGVLRNMYRNKKL
jgi:hypothetical protein